MAARKRKDPTSHSADGYRAYDQIDGMDETREYKLVNPNDELSGVEVYEAMGYTIETRRPGGPKPRVGKTVGDGQAITVLGQYLMSRPKSEAVAEYEAGQKRADALDRRILRDGNIDDGLRGQSHRLGVDRDQTSGPFVELEGA